MAKYIAAGQNNFILVSSDGVTWTVAHADDSSGLTLDVLAYDGQTTVVLGGSNNTELWVSIDGGGTFNQVSGLPANIGFGVSTLAGFGLCPVVIWDGTQFVAIGWISGSPPLQGKIGKSSDGVTWTWSDINTNGGSGQFCGIAFNGTTYVALEWNGFVSANAKFYSSPDLSAWTLRYTSTAPTFSDAEYAWLGTSGVNAGKFLSLSSGSFYAASSPDGITWTEVATAVSVTVEQGEVLWDAPSSQWIVAGLVDVGGVEHVGIATSPDGVTWMVTLDLGVLHGGDWTTNSVVRSGSNLYAWLSSGIGSTFENSSPYKSTNNGASWTNLAAPSDDVSPANVAWDGAQFVSLDEEGDGGNAISTATSPDAINWTDQYNDTAFDLRILRILVSPPTPMMTFVQC